MAEYGIDGKKKPGSWVLDNKSPIPEPSKTQNIKLEEKHTIPSGRNEAASIGGVDRQLTGGPCKAHPRGD